MSLILKLSSIHWIDFNRWIRRLFISFSVGSFIYCSMNRFYWSYFRRDYFRGNQRFLRIDDGRRRWTSKLSSAHEDARLIFIRLSLGSRHQQRLQSRNPSIWFAWASTNEFVSKCAMSESFGVDFMFVIFWFSFDDHRSMLSLVSLSRLLINIWIWS